VWKAGLLARLVRNVHAALGGEEPVPQALSPEQEQLLDAREFALVARDDEIEVACPDRAGIIATVSGALALHRLEIRSLAATTRDGFALVSVVAVPRFGSGPDWQLVRSDLRRGLDDPGPLAARVRQRELDYPPPVSTQPPSVRWVDHGVSEPVLEVRAPDGLGVLHRIAAAIEMAGGEVHSARCQTMGADVVDTFTVADLPPDERTRVTETVLSVLGA
jgi:[protein-PII] uridylyltransferase